MHGRTAGCLGAAALAAFAWLGVPAAAQTLGEPEEFTAIAIATTEVAQGAGILRIRVTRWSTQAEREALITTLRERGPKALLEALAETRPVGTIRTPDSLGYDLRYAHQTPGEDGGRDIMLMTDRPISFYEQWTQPRTVQYPFAVIQMHIGPEGEGTGTLSLATRIRAYGKIIELENYGTAPIMLTEIKSNKRP